MGLIKHKQYNCFIISTFSSLGDPFNNVSLYLFDSKNEFQGYYSLVNDFDSVCTYIDTGFHMHNYKWSNQTFEYFHTEQVTEEGIVGDYGYDLVKFDLPLISRFKNNFNYINLLNNNMEIGVSLDAFSLNKNYSVFMGLDGNQIKKSTEILLSSHLLTNGFYLVLYTEIFILTNKSIHYTLGYNIINSNYTVIKDALIEISRDVIINNNIVKCFVGKIGNKIVIRNSAYTEDEEFILKI